ncbi:MAG: O-acetyl-ADP-ribose deacetylase [Bacteroidetes bacterium]|nr:O-acetyl-ADP-ribose deacetylase [Bacteroidota bacterium]
MISDRIELIKADITTLNVDAIVNAANSSLLGGGGVDGAIHRAAGRMLLEECRSLGGCPTGEARITKGYELKARYVVHTVGPVWKGGIADEPGKLASCYYESLILAEVNKCSSIAFPNISTGIYGYPKKEAALIAINSVNDYLKSHDSIQKVIFCCFDCDNYEYYARILDPGNN